MDSITVELDSDGDECFTVRDYEFGRQVKLFGGAEDLPPKLGYIN